MVGTSSIKLSDCLSKARDVYYLPVTKFANPSEIRLARLVGGKALFLWDSRWFVAQDQARKIKEADP